MLNFLENHDEQRFGSRQYAGDPSKVLPSLVVSSLMSTGPMMIYAGQELGEQATEAEGYSGNDGRTTIFDYWSLSTLRRWLADVDGLSGLTDRERWLRQLYRSVLRLCNDERAIKQGRFFDLMYVNYRNPSFDPHRQYAFLRNHDTETLLIAVNFSAEPVDLKINLPLHAFETLDIPRGEALATELLTGDKMRKRLSDSEPFETRVAAYGAVVWKTRNKNIAPVNQINRGPVGQSRQK
jgi:glycosidase